MSEQPTSVQLERFRSLVGKGLGLAFSDDKLEAANALLLRRAHSHGVPIEHYLRTLREAGKDELRALALEMTVGETYFFRHREQMDAYVQVALRARLAERVPGIPIRILSAGCSTGEEPYSLAILALQSGLPPSDLRIVGVDVNSNSIAKALAGRYSAWSLRETPESVREQWFVRSGTSFSLVPKILESVQLFEANFLDHSDEAWQGRFDIIFCRNMLMYFDPESARRVVARFSKLLEPGGFLFLGHAETLRGLSEEFELIHSHGCFFYRSGPAGVDLGCPIVSPGPEPDLPRHDWVELIMEASERISDLDRRAPGEVPPFEKQVSYSLESAKSLLDQERYADALSRLDETAGHSQEPEMFLLRAVLLTHLSEFEKAEDICRKLLASGKFEAGAHYVSALCREGRGDIGGARAGHAVAKRLDPAFALPYLHLGLLARRSQEYDLARSELEKALLLLRGEDRERLRLFSAGFGREALTELCRAELGLCGGKK